MIALAAERALAGGTNTLDALNMVKEFRQKDTETPVVLMGYLNPVEVIGYEKFVSIANECGVDGVLLVDLPPEEAKDFDQVLKKFDMGKSFYLHRHQPMSVFSMLPIKPVVLFTTFP